MIDQQKLKDVESILRIFLASLLLMTSAYKFMVGGDAIVKFYHDGLLANPYGVSMTIFEPFLRAIGIIELVMGLMLLFTRVKYIALYGYFVFLTVLMFGHFALSEFHEVNGLFDYMLAGLIIYLLPTHQSITRHFILRSKQTL